MLTDFYQGTNKPFSVTCLLNGVAQDITNDTVTFFLKENLSDKDANALLVLTADVTSQGASGIALFEIDADDTEEIDPGRYIAHVLWETAANKQYVAYQEVIEIFERASDL
jgi:hypothetical protein